MKHTSIHYDLLEYIEDWLCLYNFFDEGDDHDAISMEVLENINMTDLYEEMDSIIESFISKAIPSKYKGRLN